MGPVSASIAPDDIVRTSAEAETNSRPPLLVLEPLTRFLDEHALGAGADARAAAYVEAGLPDGRTMFGVGMDRDIVNASLRAVTSIAGRARHA